MSAESRMRMLISQLNDKGVHQEVYGYERDIPDYRIIQRELNVVGEDAVFEVDPNNSELENFLSMHLYLGLNDIEAKFDDLRAESLEPELITVLESICGREFDIDRTELIISEDSIGAMLDAIEARFLK